VGGDERQRQYAVPLCEYFSTAGRNVTPVFIYSGWASNWNTFVDEFDRKKNTADGLVAMRFMRTEFGRTIRRRWTSGPQVGGWGHGFDSLRRLIEDVAGKARQQVS
jgi:hypothetical protein